MPKNRGEGGLTRYGKRMNPVIRQRIIDVLSDPASDRLSLKELAAKAGVSRRTFSAYRVDELLDEVAKRRTQISGEDLLAVERALLTKAKDGDVSAAKLLYARVAQREGKHIPDDDMTLEEIEAELQRLKAKRDT